MNEPPDAPRALKDVDERERRVAALQEPHVAPLTRYVLKLRARDACEYPHFDPADGGVDAELLFLFEKPGPMTVPRGRLNKVGSGFISRDNDDNTAEATFRFMDEAGLPRKKTVLWNTVPGWNGRRAITQDELRAGINDLKDVLPLLPRLRVIVLVGKKAAEAEPYIKKFGGFVVLKSPHPSQLVKASYPKQWFSIPGIWRLAATEAGVTKRAT